MNLSYNKITATGAIGIAKLLSTDCTLLRLNLSNNYVSTDGAVEIADALSTNNTLLKINLSHNIIQSKYDYIAEMLESNYCLTSFYLGIVCDDINNIMERNKVILENQRFAKMKCAVK